ncbi:hypothetical protein HAX54_031081 [Datura stramonium]|uniref:Uncharacterized protein n=1 Tax=Datura stramonium TaxID=4076 RepID=A0ABS8VBF6_DATST|nr:hypothetical protein [Datura stramonium]
MDQSDGPLSLITNRCIRSWEHYNITSSEEYLVVTTREKSKAQEAVTATTSPPQSDEGSDEAESDGENPSADNVEKGNDGAEELGDDDTNVEDSVAEESNEKVEDLILGKISCPSDTQMLYFDLFIFRYVYILM